MARQLSVGSPGVEYHVNDRPYYSKSKSILEILASLKIYLALNTAGVELTQCHWNVIFEISLSSIDWVINTNTSQNVGLVGIESEGFCVRFWEPEGWVDFGRRPIEMQKRKLSMEQLKVWLKMKNFPHQIKSYHATFRIMKFQWRKGGHFSLVEERL